MTEHSSTRRTVLIAGAAARGLVRRPLGGTSGPRYTGGAAARAASVWAHRVGGHELARQADTIRGKERAWRTARWVRNASRALKTPGWFVNRTQTIALDHPMVQP
jgi:hypothetical protein